VNPAEVGAVPTRRDVGIPAVRPISGSYSARGQRRGCPPTGRTAGRFCRTGIPIPVAAPGRGPRRRRCARTSSCPKVSWRLSPVCCSVTSPKRCISTR